MLTITNMRQIMPFIDGRPEFVVIDKGDYYVLDYVYQTAETFDSPEAMECRGIKFDREGLILARPFRKFFNFGEQGSGLPFHRPHVITDKLDGSMIHPALIGNRLFFHTRKGHTDAAKKVERFVMSSDRGYARFCLNLIRRGWTPIFEYIGPDNRIVLRYDESDLVLLAIRHTVEGYFMEFNEAKAWADNYHVPTVPPLNHMNLMGINEFVDHARGLEDAEGYVVYFDQGYMVKVKAEDYVLKHRALDDMSSKKKVVALCCQGFSDDVLPILNDADRAELMQFDHDLQEEISLLAMTAQKLSHDHASDRKKFALEVAPDLNPKWLAGVVFGIMDGKNARQLVLKAVEKGGYEDIGVLWRGE